MEPDSRLVIATAQAHNIGSKVAIAKSEMLGPLATHPDFRKQLLPTGTWLSIEDPAMADTDLDRTWVADGRRLEPGGQNLMACAAMIEALKVLLEPGIPAIAEHIQRLQRQLLAVLELRGIWLEEVRRLTRAAGALLIFDEVITGFRVALGGAQELLGVVPDAGASAVFEDLKFTAQTVDERRVRELVVQRLK